MKIAHTADHHWCLEYQQKCQQSTDFILSQLSTIQPDLHIIAGDYWDKRQSLNNRSAVNLATAAIISFAEISPVVLIYGNESHDNAGSLEVFKSLKTKHPIFISSVASVVALKNNRFYEHMTDVMPESPEALIYLFPYPTKSWFFKENSFCAQTASDIIVDMIKKIMNGWSVIGSEYRCPKLMAFHGNVLGARLSNGQTLIGHDILIPATTLEMSDADVICGGHIHKSQKIANKFYYSGSIFHKTFGETEDKLFYLHEIDGENVHSSPIIIPSRRLSIHECFYDNKKNALVDENQENDWLDAELRVRVYLNKEDWLSVREEDVQSKYRDAYSYKIEKVAIPRHRIRTGEIVGPKKLSEKVEIYTRATGSAVNIEIIKLKSDEIEKIGGTQ